MIAFELHGITGITTKMRSFSEGHDFSVLQLHVRLEDGRNVEVNLFAREAESVSMLGAVHETLQGLRACSLEPNGSIAHALPA